jgi:SPP1 family predicted phage head-tail adaptor
MSFDPLYINPGELRHTVTIQAPDTADPDAYGQSTTNWKSLLTTRAKIESTDSASYKDSFAQNAIAAQSTDLITIRWPGASIVVAPGQRVIFGDNLYLIQSVDNVLHRNRKVRLATMMVDENSN